MNVIELNEATLSNIFAAAMLDATDGLEVELHGANFGVIIDADDEERETLYNFIVKDDGSVMAW